VVENWKGKVALLYKDLREKYDSEFERLKDENRRIREQLENIQYEKTNLEVRITEADAEFKEAHIKERKSKQIQDLLTEQIEKLKQEKGMIRVGLNKDVLISKMKVQIENLNAKKDTLSSEINECRLWAVSVMDQLKEERN